MTRKPPHVIGKKYYIIPPKRFKRSRIDLKIKGVILP